jgi:Phosphotransferase enzyme family
MNAAQPGRGAVRSAIVHLSVALHQAAPRGLPLLNSSLPGRAKLCQHPHRIEVMRNRYQPYQRPHVILRSHEGSSGWNQGGRSSNVAMYATPELAAAASQVPASAAGGVKLARQRGNIAELAEICQTWGASVATLHTMPTHGSATPLVLRPWVLSPQNLIPSVKSAEMPGYTAVLEAYESSADLRAAIREVDDRWTEQHLIHGDLSTTTVLVEHRPALRVSFLDLEHAGLGDPAWDLASALDTIVWMAPRWQVVPQPLVDYFLLGYRRVGGPGRLYPAMQAVRALTTALRVAGSQRGSLMPQPTEAGLTVWVDRAKAYAARVGYLMTVA